MMNRDPDRPREARFERLWAEHYDAVYAYLLRRAPSAADEVAAEVFAIAWRRLDAFEDAIARPWLYGVARRLLLNTARSTRRRDALAQRLRDEARGDTSDDVADRFGASADEKDALRRALDGLSERDRETLRLVAWEELDSRELATALGCSAAAARVRLHRARRRLRRELDAATRSPRATAELRHLEET